MWRFSYTVLHLNWWAKFSHFRQFSKRLHHFEHLYLSQVTAESSNNYIEIYVSSLVIQNILHFWKFVFCSAFYAWSNRSTTNFKCVPCVSSCFRELKNALNSIDTKLIFVSSSSRYQGWWILHLLKWEENWCKRFTVFDTGTSLKPKLICHVLKLNIFRT